MRCLRSSNPISSRACSSVPQPAWAGADGGAPIRRPIIMRLPERNATRWWSSLFDQTVSRGRIDDVGNVRIKRFARIVVSRRDSERGHACTPLAERMAMPAPKPIARRMGRAQSETHRAGRNKAGPFVPPPTSAHHCVIKFCMGSRCRSLRVTALLRQCSPDHLTGLIPRPYLFKATGIGCGSREI